jgi:hypothetical protein
MTVHHCRFCNAELQHSLVDLGMSPLSNAFLRPENLDEMERFYPLHARVCAQCLLVQVPEFQSPQDIFSDYAYFSSYSESWLRHAKEYVRDMVSRFTLNASSHVVEIASNDGYLLQYFKERNIPILGVEPASNVAAVAQKAGIPTIVKFFGVQTAQELAQQGHSADLLLGNNVLAHVPDLNDFVAGLEILLQPQGVITMEFAHVLHLIEQNEFDTIYHEHFSYLSLLAVETIFAAHGLTLFDVEEIPTHGGSLRIFARHAQNESLPVLDSLQQLRAREKAAGLHRMETYAAARDRARDIKCDLLDFLIKARRQGKTVAAYGAPAKGNTLLNYCGIGSDLLEYTVDRSPHKQGLYLPGTRIPIFHPDKISETKPDYILILPWNLQAEIMEQMAAVREWGCRFVVPIPRVEVLP